MKKTTQELAIEADFHPVTASSTLKHFEAFRQLVIENERECAKAVAYVDLHYGIQRIDEGIGLPKGAQLFTFPPASIDRNAVIEECAKVCEELERNGFHYETYDGWDEIPAEACHCVHAVRALKSQPATPDPRNEALRIARDALENCEGMLDEMRGYPITIDLVIEALAAIDKVMKGGE